MFLPLELREAKMMKETGKKAIIVGTIFILITMSIVPIQASDIKRETALQKTQLTNNNVIGTLTLKWNNFLMTSKLSWKINFNQSTTRDFYFTEVNGTLQNVNFTIICKQWLENRVIVPRFIKCHLALYNDTNGVYYFDYWTHRFWIWGNPTVWKYSNFSVGPKEQINSLKDNITVQIYFYVRGSFPMINQAANFTLENITVHKQ
jgi:hypothetical protein